jgi:hypothetical protein
MIFPAPPRLVQRPDLGMTIREESRVTIPVRFVNSRKGLAMLATLVIVGAGAFCA